MLKAGEYSPNNPLIRSERSAGDALLGLGEYERRRNTLRKIRQQQYKEYLDDQAKKKQEAKEKAEKERREREERERLRAERQRGRLERERERSPEFRRTNFNPAYESSNTSVPSTPNNPYPNKVDTGVQVGLFGRPLSVAVQTDSSELFPLPSPAFTQLTEAERELSPRTVVEADDRLAQTTDEQWQKRDSYDNRPIELTNEQRQKRDTYHDRPIQASDKEWQKRVMPIESNGEELKRDRAIQPTNEDWQKWDNYDDKAMEPNNEQRQKKNSYHDKPKQSAKEDWQKKEVYQDGQLPLVKKSNRDKLVADLRHTYMPSIFDADAIQLRNLQAEKEAAERRRYYQQELKNQILEQQRIKEERKAREKMLEQAEMRRLEDQLRMLKALQEKEIGRQDDITDAMKENAAEYDIKRKSLQKEIDLEQTIIRSKSQPCRVLPKRTTYTSQSDSNKNLSKLPFYYPKIDELSNEIYNDGKNPLALNIPENSVLSSNYDVESYLRKNLNPSKETLNMFNDVELDRIKTNENKQKRYSLSYDFENNNFDKSHNESPKLPNLETSETHKKFVPIKRKDTKDVIDESFPIPILRHSVKNDITLQNNNDKLSDAMKLIDDKWKVPAVQKNILKSMPSKDGKNINILTQLGSIRRQLQLEQLKLDEMLCKDAKV